MRPQISRFVLVAALGVPGLVHAQSHWSRQVADYIRRTATTLRRQGLAPTGAPQVGALFVDESVWFRVTLRAGVSYTVISACDNDCNALELALYEGAQYEIEADRGSAVPMVKVTPRETQRYRVKLTLTGCSVSPCWYGIGVFRRSATPRAP